MLSCTAAHKENELIHSIWRQHRPAQNAHNVKFGCELYILCPRSKTQAGRLTVLTLCCPLNACSFTRALAATAFNSNMQHFQHAGTPCCVVQSMWVDTAVVQTDCR